MLEMINSIDSGILLWIQENIRNEFLTSLFLVITKLGDDGIFFIITGIVLTIFKKTRKLGIVFLTALVLNFIVNNLVLKNVVARIRPYEVEEGLKALIPPVYGYSFPSGHTSSAFTCAVTLWFYNKKIFYGAFVVAALIGFSRIYLGVHYPTDVLFGAVFGTLIAIFTAKIFNLMNKKSYF